MKKILFLLSFLIATSVAFCQFPQNQTIGADSTLVTSKGGLKGKIIFFSYVDTIAANNQRISQYPFAAIVTPPNLFWLRNSTATRWVQVSGGSGGGIDSITTEKTFDCLDIQKYWIGGIATPYDTIQVYDGIIKQGTITQIDTLTFNVNNFLYRLNCQIYLSPDDTTVTVSPPNDSLLRIDYIGGNDLGQVQVIEGIPSEVATPPLYNQTAFLPFTQVFISPDTTYIIPIAPNLDGRYVKIAVPDTITAQKTVRDTLILGPYPLASDNLIIKAGTPINQFAYAIDTVALQQVRANFWQYVIGTSGTTVPKYSMLFKSPYATPLSLNANGEASFGNGLVMELGGKIHGNAITYLGNSATLKHNITGATGALNANGVVLQVDNSTTSDNGALSRSLSVRGNGYRRVLEGYTQGVVANNDNPSSKAVIDFNGQDNVPNSLRGEGKGVIFPRMTTAQRDGIPKRVATVTLTDGGTTMTTAPIVSVVTTGIRPVIIPTLVGGVVTALTLIDGGSNITANGNLVFDTTGTFATTIPIGTYTFTTDTIPNALMVFNTDSGCYQSYYKTANAWVNMREGSGGGGGGGLNTNFANADLVADADRFHDFDGHSLNISTGANSSSSFIQDTVKFQWEVDDPAVAGKTRVNISDSTFVANSSNGATGGRIISGKDSIKVEVATSNHVQTMFISEEYLVYRYKDDSSGGTDSTYNVLFPQDYSRTDTLATKAYARSVGGGGGSGTVTNVSRTNGYGITASVANSTTTPNITIAVDTATLFPAIRATLPPETYDSLKTKYPIVITSTGGLDSIGLSQSYQDSLVNDVTKINDSTIRVFKAGTSTDLLIRGNASGGGGGSQNLNQVAQVDSSLRTTIVAYSPNGVDTLSIRDSIVHKVSFASNTANNTQKAKLIKRIQSEKYNTLDPAGKKQGRISGYILSNNYNGGGSATHRQGFIWTEGYNINSGGSAELSGEGYFQTTLETDYQRKFEWYHQVGVDQPSYSGGHLDTRPMMLVVSKDTLLSELAFRLGFLHVGPIDTAADYMNSQNGKFTIDNIPGRFSSSLSNTIFEIKKSGTTISLTNNGSSLSFGGATGYGFSNHVTPLAANVYNSGGNTARWLTVFGNSSVFTHKSVTDANYTLLSTDHTINFRNITANRTLTLNNIGIGRVLQIVTGQALYKVTFAGATVKNPDGTTAVELPAGKSCIISQCDDNSTWIVVAVGTNL